MTVFEPIPVHDVFALAGTSLDGRFEVDRAVAEGGFGVVYRARQSTLDRAVALKVLKTPYEFGEAAKQQFLEVFATEAKTIARITHPNIVHVHDFGVSVMPSGERAAWMALEWLTGVTLEDELLARTGSGGRSPADCFAILKPVLSALAVVHAAGVAHRDLKPANIMMVPTPAGTVPRLLDFGIAKIMEPDEAPGTGHTHTRSRHTAFSPAYASPEQISHGRSGPWTDVHAIALILTEMLTDRAPLGGDNADMAVLFRQILDPSRPTPAKLGVSVGEWEPVLLRALAVTPSERYRDAGELLRALEATLPDASGAYARSVTPSGPPSRSLAAGPTRRAPASHSADAMTVVPATTATGSVSGGTTKPRTWVYAVSAVAALAITGALALRATATRQTAPGSTGIAASAATTQEGESPAAAAAPTAPATGAVEAPPAPPSSTSPSVPAHPESRRPATSPAGRSKSPSSPTAALPATATKPKVNCDPPFTVDSAGDRHYKPECDN